ncbi:TonB-linked outer membrane protein, SusC/RagA family [Mucilaginibacter pineti]|uniref:TonB-linked outer membrane protein, SusC/RagA family n=1 Tax=Mucilaginibacter pineti TaxID=1391627 RepID=A0A1G7HBZ3_9SPHI|nr:SusC/RagA family TonB-linked outer membrane protein [Mucilaginibacter pineti]SDE97982.1 TonB-linked outer membrane protein, SusC/RagA family [Mucilaginibacter pineti]
MKYLYLLIILLSPVINFAQTITGTVRNISNEPLPGVTVTLKGINQFVITNEKGEFTISVNDVTAILRFTAATVEPLEVTLAGQKNINVTLLTKVNKLDEVQIIAYGTNTQRYNVGSVTKVTADDISKQAVSNPLAALQGRVPGLVVSATSGIPGAAFNVQIRGQNTIKSNLQTIVTPRDNPLFIIDGVPYAPQNGSVNQFPSLASPGIAGVYNNAYGGLSPFNSINPSDIESIEVLRDADATAIYGSRGGNGVILITTKKGKAGKTDFNLNASNGISVVGHTMPMMNTQQYLGMRKEALANGGLTPNLTLYDDGFAPDLLAFDTTRYTDWKKVFLGNTAHNTNVNGSVSGGSTNTQFRISGGYNRDTYIFPGDFADSRASFLMNLHHTSLNQKLTLDFSSNYSYDKNNSAGAPNLLTAYSMEPNYPSLLDGNGNLVWDYKGISLSSYTPNINPFSYLKSRYYIQNKSLNSNLQIGYKLLDGLTFRSSLGYNTFYSQEYYGNPKSAQNPAGNPTASARFGNNNYTTWIAEPQLEYRNTLGKGAYSILIGGTYQRNSNSKTEVDGSGYINDNLIESISGAPTQNASDSYSEYRYAAIFGRINYRWDNKYILNINARRDGSSRFGPNKQFGDFGSVGAGWLFNEESFVNSNLAFLSYGKLRGSYGITGSDAVADYQYLSRWAPTNYTYQGGLGYLPQNLYNPTFSWATTKKLEFGLELGFLQDRILFNSTWYRDRSGNQLITYQLPALTGFNSVVENWDAVVQNTGLELTLQVSVIKSKRFSWTSSFNMTLPKNKVLSFPNLEKSSYSTTYTAGQSINTVYGFKSAGVNATTGVFQFYDTNGQITDSPLPPSSGKFNDYYNIGNLDPKFYGGFQNTFTYNGVQLDVFVEFKKQLGVNYLQQVYYSLPGMEQNLPVALLNRWKAPGDQTNIQKYSVQYGAEYDAGSNFFQSSGVYSDASYIRIKTVSLSYNLPVKLTKKFNIQNLRIYASAQNLFTITRYLGNDPETQTLYGVPPLKTISCGLQLTL